MSEQLQETLSMFIWIIFMDSWEDQTVLLNGFHSSIFAAKDKN